MRIYICVVSNRYPENYEIGLRSATWGVEEKYESKIAPVRPMLLPRNVKWRSSSCMRRTLRTE